MRASRFVISTIVFVLAVFLSGASLWAQTAATGALTVTVTDPSGAVIVGATVTVSNAAALTRTQQTESSGSYTFGLLPPGEYKVSISAQGFKTVEVPAVTVNVTETHVLNQALEVGAQQEQVTVSTTAETVQTETSALGGVVGSRSLASIPLTTRNYEQIAVLSPGVMADVNDATLVGRSAKYISVNGSTNINNSYQMDGISINNFANSNIEEPNSFYGAIPVPSPDALQEFKVQTSSYDASYGRNSGAAVNLVTKSGTNDWHGSAFEFIRNDKLNANGFFQNANSVPIPRPSLKENQFGATIGGPIKKDKLFFFISYQGTRQVNAGSSTSTSTATFPSQFCTATTANGTCTTFLPRTAAALGAAFCPANNPAGAPGAIFSTTKLGGTQVACDGSNINSVSLFLLNEKLPNGQLVIPNPQSLTNLTKASELGQSVYNAPATFLEDQAIGNLDYVISPKNTLSFRYYYAWGTSLIPFLTAGEAFSFNQSRNTGNNLFNLKLTTLLTSNLVNEVHGSSYYIRAVQLYPGRFSAASQGITSASNANPEVPVISITGVSSLFGNAVDEAYNPEINYEWADQLSWTHGRHTIRVGYDQIRVQWNFCSCGKSRGTIGFTDWADFLLAEPAAQNGTAQSNISSVGASGQSFANFNVGRENQASPFVQDDFKVSRRLTLNLGLRWEYDGTPWDANTAHGGTSADLALLQTMPIPPSAASGGTFVGYTVANNFAGTIPTGVIVRPYNLLTYKHSPYDDFSPRIGLAWQPFGTNGRFVIRSGAGEFYQLNNGQHFLDTLDGNPPLAAALSLSGTQAALATFAVPFNPPVTPGSFASFARSTTSARTYTAVDQHLIVGHTYTWNLNIQYEFKPTWVLELAYVGNRGLHLQTGWTTNYPVLSLAGVDGINNTAVPQVGVNCNNLVANGGTGCVTFNTQGNVNQRVPLVGVNPAGYSMTSNTGDSYYHSVQATLRKSFSNGFQFQASYTFGHCITDVAGADFTAGLGGSTTFLGALNNRVLARSNCGFNRPQRLIVNYTYQAPNYHNAEGFAGKLLSGWGVSGVTTIQAGLPMTLTDSNLGLAWGGGGGAQLCPGMTYGNLLSSGSVESRLGTIAGTNYFNLNAIADTIGVTRGLASCPIPFVASANRGLVNVTTNGVTTLQPDPNATDFGNMSQQILYGPGQFNWDISISKATRVGGIHEDATLQFRADFFNAFNIAQFAAPASLNVNSANFGQITATSTGPRVMQFGLRYIF